MTRPPHDPDPRYVAGPEPVIREPDPARLRRGIGIGLLLELIAVAVIIGVIVLIAAARTEAPDRPDAGNTAERKDGPHGPTAVDGGRTAPVLPGSPEPSGASVIPPTGAIGTVLIGGEASWYDDGPGLYGAVNSYRWGDPRYFVKVCRADDTDVCVRVVVRDHMANEVRAIDLSPSAFAALWPTLSRGAALDRGVVQVTLETYDGAAPTLPATDTP